jgi:hypothetical protein
MCGEEFAVSSCFPPAAKLKACLPRFLYGAIARARSIERPLNQRAEPVNHAATSKIRQLNFLFFPRLEADRRSRGNVQPHAVSLRAIESELCIRLKEMEVAPQLDGPVAGIFHEHPQRATSNIRMNWAGRLVEQILSGFHGAPSKFGLEMYRTKSVSGASEV